MFYEYAKKNYLGMMTYCHSIFYPKPNLQAICTQTIQFSSETKETTQQKKPSRIYSLLAEEILLTVASHPFANNHAFINIMSLTVLPL